MIRVQVDHEDWDRTVRSLESTMNSLEPIQETLQFFEGQVLNEFITGHDPYGNPWAPLSDVTLAFRKRNGRTSDQILVDTGKMVESVRIEGDQLVVDDPAQYHQEGNDHMLERKILPIEGEEVNLPPTWEQRMQYIFDQALQRV